MRFEYIIITVGNYTQSQLDEFDSCCVNWVHYARYNTDRTKCLLKLACNKPIPDCFNSITRYNASEIVSALAADEWQVRDDGLTSEQVEELLTEVNGAPTT